MDDLRQDSQTEYFALCSKHFEASCFSRSVLIGTPVDFKTFYLEKVSVSSIYAKPKDSLVIDYIDWSLRNEGRLANRFFHEKCTFKIFFLGGGGGRVGGLRMCHLPYHPLDFQGKIKNFCHPTLLTIRFKITVTPPPRPCQWTSKPQVVVTHDNLFH